MRGIARSKMAIAPILALSLAIAAALSAGAANLEHCRLFFHFAAQRRDLLFVRHPIAPDPPGSATAGAAPPVTTITIGPEVLHSGVKRFGINLSGQTFYDSGQMLKNLVFRNPGFEGETWQSFLRCKSVSANACVDETSAEAWPAGFFTGATYEVIAGRGTGQTGLVRATGAPDDGHGVTLTFANNPPGLAAGDTLLVRMEKPGGAEEGWWPSLTGGAKLSTEFHDLSPETPGRQALRIDAAQAGQSATVSSYFDSLPGHSFVQLHDAFVLRFRAKGLTGGRKLSVTLSRGSESFLREDIQLAPAWHDYSFRFSARENGTAIGTVGLTFSARETSLLLDDVELIPAAPTATAFRDEVVEALRNLHPGILRFMDNGTSFGSTLDDLLAPPLARRRGGWSFRAVEQQDIPIGLKESLELARAVGAEPWYTLPATTSPAEMRELIEYLASPPTTPYGEKRAARGQSAPWTGVFPAIHLELGNEVWNAGDFGGASLPDPSVYATRVAAVFGAARQSPYFKPSQFDLIAGGQVGNHWRTQQFLKTQNRETSLDFAPYIYPRLDDVSSIEAVFGPMFAEPEADDSPAGLVGVDAGLTRQAGFMPSIYEVNLGTVLSRNNAVSQQQIDSILASVGGAVAVADHMLLMLRELGIVNQCLFALPEYSNRFNEPDGANKTVPLWGSVVDMGGATNRRRPAYLALQLLNQAILPNELATHLSGANPTWNQPVSPNEDLPATQPRLLQVFAFAEGAQRSLILINLSRTASLPVSFSGATRPTGKIGVGRLTSASITDTNEDSAKVAIESRELPTFDPSGVYPLPPFSITTVRWRVRP